MSCGELMDLTLQTAAAAKEDEVQFCNKWIFPESLNLEGLFWNTEPVMDIATVYTYVPIRKCIM